MAMKALAFLATALSFLALTSKYLMLLNSINPWQRYACANIFIKIVLKIDFTDWQHVTLMMV